MFAHIACTNRCANKRISEAHRSEYFCLTNAITEAPLERHVCPHKASSSSFCGCYVPHRSPALLLAKEQKSLQTE